MTPTIRDAVALAAGRLRAAGIPAAEADADARLMAQWLLGWDTARYLTAPLDQRLPQTFHARYESLVSRREQREPMAYLFGGQEFWGLMFEVTRDVLIPRPETELIVDTVLQLFPDPAAPLRIADVGTGSGCLAVALARERPNALVMATDVSPLAVMMVARLNAERHGVDERIRFRTGALFAGSRERFDVIVSNPPYVPEADRATLQPEVRDHEPAMALYGGSDGLSVIRDLLPAAAERLVEGGHLVFEFGFGQAETVARLISATAGLTMVALKDDLQGIPRVAVCRR